MSDENKITLYPSNWLYNAGVVGFLRVLEACGVDINKYFVDGKVEIFTEDIDANKLFEKWDEFTFQRLKISYKGKKVEHKSIIILIRQKKQ